jgi:predicted ATPase
LSVIAELVELLDRRPLAIELAAARSRVMSPHKLLSRMGNRFRLLSASGRRRDRQSTLRATLDWSWNLLEDWEKSTLAQLSVFTGDDSPANHRIGAGLGDR